MHGIGKVMLKQATYMNDSSSESSYESENEDNDDVVIDVAPPSPLAVPVDDDKVASKKGQMRLKKYQKALREYAGKYATLRDDEEKSAFTLEFALEYPLGKGKKKAGTSKPRRQSAYNVFFTHKLKELKNVGKDNAERLTMVGKMWAEMGEEDRKVYQAMADNKNAENDPTYDANAVKKVVKEKSPEQLFLVWLKEQMTGMAEFAGVRGKELHKMALKEKGKEEYAEKRKEFYHNYGM